MRRSRCGWGHIFRRTLTILLAALYNQILIINRWWVEVGHRPLLTNSPGVIMNRCEKVKFWLLTLIRKTKAEKVRNYDILVNKLYEKLCRNKIKLHLSRIIINFGEGY